jgi:hypothetical protein
VAVHVVIDLARAEDELPLVRSESFEEAPPSRRRPFGVNTISGRGLAILA